MSGNDTYGLRCTGQMLPALLHGLAIARNTAMCYGRVGDDVKAEFSAMLEDLAGQCGVPKLLNVVDEYRWYKACEALKTAKEFSWYVQEGDRDWRQPDSPRKPGNMSLIVDGRAYPLEHHLSEAEPHIERIREMIEIYASVDAVKGPDERGWRSCEEEAKERRERSDAEAKAQDSVDEDAEDDLDASIPKP